MQSGQFRFPKIIIWLPLLQDKTHLLGFLYAYEMTAILYHEKEGSNKILFILVFHHTQQTLLYGFLLSKDSSE